MSVLVPSFPSSSHSHYFPNRRINGNHSQSTKHISLLSHTHEDDQVPFGVVNSMKQRLLDKFNESLLLNTRHPISKSSNENLLQTKPNLSSPLKQITRLSRSQDSLLDNNNHSEQFLSYLQPKQELIIIDQTISDEKKILSYTELHIDEVPKPGTVSTVKNMFERQIRLSRYDRDKSPNPSISTNTRVNHQHRDIRSPTRSRSISPNDMALRQRRATSIPIPTPLSVPVSASYPDLVISHTPSHGETTKIPNKESVNYIQKDESMNQNRPNLLLASASSSDTADYEPMDFKSRLALFNRTNTIERSNEHSHTSTNIKKLLNHPQSIPPPSNFLTKPVLHHHHQSEKKEVPSNAIVRSVTNTTKSITFFGGIKTNENTKSILASSIDPPLSSIPNDETSVIDLLDVPDVIGGNVKLNKSSIFSGIKKDTRVQFIDDVNTFEYPSFTIIMAEHGSIDLEDDVNDDELERLARINAEYTSTNLPEKTIEPKGTLHTFRPTHLDQYELGSQHGSRTSDTFSREKYFSLSENFSNHSILKQELTNPIQWSSMSTTTDLLF